MLCYISGLQLSDSDIYTQILCPWGFSRQEYWSGLPCPLPGHLSNPGIKPRCPTWQADSLSSTPPEKPKNTGKGSLSLCPSPVDLPGPGIKAGSPALQVDSLPAELPGKSIHTHTHTYIHTHTHTHTPTLFQVFSLLYYHKILSIFPCAIQ